VPVATSVTDLDASLSDLVDQPHALVALDGAATGTTNAVACGAIGGAYNGQDLLFGLQEQNDSGYTGVGWVTTRGDSGVTVTLFLTSHVVPTGIMGTPAVSEAGTAAPETASAATPAAETPAAAAASTPAAAGMPTTVTIESVDIDFIPAEVTVPANTDVTIDLPNHGQITHNFSITDHKNPDVPNLGISVNIQPGATEHVTVNAPPGDYYYYCNIPGHEAAGMWGTMHVVAQ
jgi:nitrite reductase (NO-forming)